MTVPATISPEDARALTNRIKAGFTEARYLRALRSSLPEPQQPKPEKQADRRSVYFIEAPNGFVKIGVAGDPRARLRTLRTMSPVPLRIALVLPGLGAAGEAELHQRFAAHRSHGEWFRPAAEITDFIKENS